MTVEIMKLRSVLGLGALFLGALLGSGQVGAHPVGTGPDDPRFGTQLITPVDCVQLVCTVSPVAITADPGAPNWLKTFNLDGPVGAGGIVTILEEIVVGQPGNPGPNWTDWHEALNPAQNWSWLELPLRPSLSATLGAVTLTVVGTVSADGQEVDFSGFDLAPGTLVFIQKSVQCMDSVECHLLEVREWPTIAAVPAPATLFLLALGLLGLTASRRKS